MPDKNNRKILVLLDAHAVLHRAFHALPEFASPKGEPTGAIYGFTAFLIKILRELKPDYIAAAYDLPQPTFRHIAYENYKAKRPKMDDNLAKQISRSRDILKQFNIPVYDAPGFEADDVLGTIVEKMSNKKIPLKTIIASGDMDTLQLVKDDDVVVYTLKKGIQDTVIYDEKAVIERYGFGPELITDFKALKGDPSDNIVGVKGIGDKSATELIKNFGPIENLYKEIKEGLPNIKLRTLGLLKENEEEAMFSKTLAEIRKDAPVNFSLEDCAWKDNYDEEKIKTIFNELGFRSLIARLKDIKSHENAQPAVPHGATQKNNLAQKPKSNTEIPEKLNKEIEIPLAKILAEMEKAGILLDVDYLKKLSKEYHKKLDILEKKIWNLAGEEFNINSPKQLGEVLFAKMGLGGTKPKKTATGAYATNVSQLLKLKDEHEIIGHIMENREIAKLVSTYIDALPKLVDENNRLHTHFDSFGTATGRLSSQNPNLQNIPKRSERGREVRRAFVADRGFKLAAFDYSQIDLRAAAILSGDKNLVEIFQQGGDAHASAAAKVFKVRPEEVTAEMRRKIKVINFGVLYGMGLNALRQNLGGTREEAQKFYEEYFVNFSGLKDFIEKTKKFALQNGYTETLFGRRRYFPELNAPEEYIRKEGERMAVNMPIQGTSADFIKLAMVRADEILGKAGLKDGARLLLQIHDELLFEIKEDAIAKAAPIIIKAMEGVYPLDHKQFGSALFKDLALPQIPIKVNAEIGENWEEMGVFSQT